MDEEQIVVGAQFLGRALQVLCVVLAVAVAYAGYRLWRHF
jgi:hypothetical protein